MRFEVCLGVLIALAVGCSEEPAQDAAWCAEKEQSAAEAFTLAKLCDLDADCQVEVVLCSQGGSFVGVSNLDAYSTYESLMSSYREGGCDDSQDPGGVCEGFGGCDAEAYCEAGECKVRPVCPTP